MQGDIKCSASLNAGIAVAFGCHRNQYRPQIRIVATAETSDGALHWLVLKPIRRESGSLREVMSYPAHLFEKKSSTAAGEVLGQRADAVVFAAHRVP